MIKSIVLNVNPSFLLRKVDPNRVIDDYFSGKYSKIGQIERTTNAPLIHHGPAMTAQIATTPDEGIYGFRNKSNITQVVATTDCGEYLSYISEETGRSIIGGRCQHCMREFNRPALGVPVRLIEVQGKLMVHYTNIACGYRCAFALWKRRYNGGTRYRDYRYIDGEQILKHLYALQYPQAGPLREAPDPFLLKCNGGCLTDEEYDNENHAYLPSQAIILAPAKMQYLRFNT